MGITATAEAPDLMAAPTLHHTAYLPPAHRGVHAVSAFISPLVLVDRLITLAQDADRAGFRDAASQLVGLVYTVLEDPQRTHPNT